MAQFSVDLALVFHTLLVFNCFSCLCSSRFRVYCRLDSRTFPTELMLFLACN